MPDRHEVLLTGDVLLLQQPDRIGPVIGRHPPCMTRVGCVDPGVRPPRATVGNTGMGHPDNHVKLNSSRACRRDLVSQHHG